MNKYFTILGIVLLSSCQPKTVEKNGGLIIDIEWNSNAKEADVNASVEILKNRINYFCYYNPSLALSPDKKSIQLKLPLITDSTLCKDYILRKGKLEIVETFENQEIYNCLANINKKLVENHNYNLKIPVDTSNFKKYPLFKVLHPPISRDNRLLSGSIIGYSQVKDTALINSIMQFKACKNLLPMEFECKWSKNRLDNFIPLVAIKKSLNSNTITPEMILNAVTYYEKKAKKYSVNFTLKPPYHIIWAKMTRNNIGRSLAIVIDNDVFSNPRVNGEIPNGKSFISGNMTLEQAKALATTLKYGVIPIDLKIKKMTIINVP